MDKIARNLAAVSRWSIVHVIRRQSVAEHCFQVARNVLWLREYMECPEMDEIFREALAYSLFHDDSEVYTGDIPAPVKRKKYVVTQVPLGDYPPVSELVSAIVKVADAYEAYIFLREEVMLGNALILSIEKGVLVHLDMVIGRFNQLLHENKHPQALNLYMDMLADVNKHLRKPYVGDLEV